MIRLMPFVVFVISLGACNSQEGRMLRPTPIPAPRSAAVDSESQAPPGSAGESAGPGASGGGGTSTGVGTIPCATPQPESNWICVNGGWVPPDHPLAPESGGSTGGEPTSGAGASSGSPAASSGATSGGCNTPQPGSNWVCLNGGWLPADHPLAAGSAGSGGASGSTGGSAAPSPGPTANGCNTPQPGFNWMCVNGGWVPSDHPLAPLSVVAISPGTGSTVTPVPVTIRGSGFLPGATVTLGATATSVTVLNSTTIFAIAPARDAGMVDVVVTTPGGQSGRLTGAFTYIVDPPYTLSPSTNTIVAGGQLSVSWTAPRGFAYDWIGFFKVGDPSTNYESGWWMYTNGVTSGSLTLAAPTVPGQYEFRYLWMMGMST